MLIRHGITHFTFLSSLVPKYHLSTTAFAHFLPPNLKAKRRAQERKLIEVCMKKQMIWMKLTGEPQDTHQQMLELPRALVSEAGLPVKGQKHKAVQFYSTQYMDKVVNDTLPQNWVPHAVIIDGMFLLYAPPPPGTTTVSEFSRILSEWYIAPYFEAGALEVHLLFDDPDRHSVSPKASERRRRYAAGSTNHVYYDFTEQLPSSQKWSSVTECCVCKHKLAQSLALELL